MFSQMRLLVCSFAISVVPFVTSQATATENGIVAATGAPEPTQMVSYSIIGGDLVAASSPVPTGVAVATTRTPTNDDFLMGTPGSDLSTSEHGLSIPAILGITLAAILFVVGIIVVVIVVHGRRAQLLARAKRKSIMDVEFGASTPHMQTVEKVNADKPANLGYFDLAKPLPAVTTQPATPPVAGDGVAFTRRPSNDRLSRSSTIIAASDAAEIAQTKRKTSMHQARRKKSGEAARERKNALRILIMNEDNRTSVLPRSPLTANPTTPVESEPYTPTTPRNNCPDGDGDAFARHPSMI